MKVAFWNNAGSTDRVSNYMAAIGTMLALECKCEVVLGSNYISNRMIQDCFFSKIKEEGIAHAPYLFLHGSPEYHAALWSMKRTRQGNILDIPMEGVTIIYPPDVAEKTMFFYEVPRTGFYLLDIAGESSAAFQGALDEADVVVVFLSQDEAKIQNFLERFSSLIPKTLFIIEVRLKNNKYSRRDFSEKYGINIRNIGIIPQNNVYKEACEEGRLEFFLKNNLSQTPKTTQDNFMSKLKNITNLLYERNICETMEECKNEQEI